MHKTAVPAILFALFIGVSTVSTVSASSLPKALTNSSKFTTKMVAQKTLPTNNSPKPPKPAVDPLPADPTVTVQSGDTLIGLADAHHSTYQRLFDANASLSDPNVINPGQQLTVPKDSEQLPDRISSLPQATQQSVAAAATAYSSSRSIASYPAVTGNDAKAFIYSRESGNNPSSTNPSGCYGLGQDCNGRVQAQCGADYACQDAYFTSYADSRYGSWDAAAAFWQTHGWW